MPASILRLPPEQLERAQAAYAAAVAAKRARVALGAVCLLLAIGLACVAGEVDPIKFLANIDRLPNYIRSLVPSLSWANFGADVAEWFWNLDEWLKLLADTLLIAYLGTLLGALGAFVLCFSACANVSPTTGGFLACVTAFSAASSSCMAVSNSFLAASKSCKGFSKAFFTSDLT
jgi:phosphonate transport system permease protein